MSSSTTGDVTEDHQNFISIMAIEREKGSAKSSGVKKSCSPKSTSHSLGKQRGRHENVVSCQELHLCGGPGGDSAIGTKPEMGENGEPASKTRGTQTDYRESETQTSPWEAPYKLTLRTNESPEILRLTKSTWGHGLPAGIHEVQIIQRMRAKRAWMEALPPMDSPENIKLREAITAAIEANEWAFREAEIQYIMDARMELMERITRNKRMEKGEHTSKRLEKYAKRLSQLRDKQVHSIRGKFLRDVRKLTVKHRASAVLSKKRRPDFTVRYCSAKTDTWANKIRSTAGIGKPQKLFRSVAHRGNRLDGARDVDDPTNLLPILPPIFGERQDRNPEELCPRETRWNEEKLKKLHADLKAIRLNDRGKDRRGVPSLLKQKIKIPSLPVTPAIKSDDYSDNHWENSSLFIQKITRGRAVQSMMFEGRNRCRELIEELKSTRALQSSTESRHSDKANVFARCVEENDKELQDNRLCEILDSLEGKTVAEMLDLLSKEDVRLREERRAHGFALLAERERCRREAEESGRRQLERNRRRELDEMFRQVVKVHQDSVEAYLEDVIKEGIEWVSNDQARRYIADLADSIDASTSQTPDHDDPAKDEQLIADTIRNFLLPEVDKAIVREKIRWRQRGSLRAARKEIYEAVESTKEAKAPPNSRQKKEQPKERKEHDLSPSKIRTND